MKAVVENQSASLPVINKSEVNKTVLNYSFLISLVYVAIFAIAKIFNLENVVEIRFLNYIMLFIIAYSAVKKMYVLNGNKMEYLPGFGRTFLTCVLGGLWYSILFFIYLHIDKQFTSALVNQFPAGILYPEVSITVTLFSEAFAMSAIVALAVLQIFKRKRGRWARS
jgi:hypothetical protein